MAAASGWPLIVTMCGNVSTRRWVLPTYTSLMNEPLCLRAISNARLLTGQLRSPW